jgi:aminopeptidase N
MKYFLVSLFFSLAISSVAQNKIDVLHYRFSIDLNDKNDSIYGHAEVLFIAKKGSTEIELDLSGGITANKDMIVTKANLPYTTPYGSTETGNVYTQYNNKLYIKAWKELATDDTLTATIDYKGIPTDGLIISRSRFGKRTFFSDNWPDRAHKWIPCHDDPADKASVEFIVSAPSHYEVVANGVLLEEKEIPGNKKLTHWKEDVPLPTKIMVIGVADFAIDTAGIVYNIPVTSWVYPENKTDGFKDYATATNVLRWFIDYVGPFPFKKLANIQSKTIFGGMENAGAIFYNEDYIATGQMDERLMAHEISHQWFGDMVTEKNFSHLWLSEGFATYLPNIYMESKYGKERIVKELKEDRQQVIDFARTSDKPVVDTISPHMELLNANSYQKGGWVLYMLREELGDSLMHASIRNFYRAYAGKNADTKDFQKVCEQTSGRNLGLFFQQWLYTPGFPELDIKWKYNLTSKSVSLTINQLQKNLFQFPLEIKLKTASGKIQLHTLSIRKQNQEFVIPFSEKVTEIEADPNTSLLFEGTVSRIK